MVGFDGEGGAEMAENRQLVLVAAYQDDQLAQQEFDALVGLVKAKEVRTDGLILVAKDAEGTVRLSDTGDHLGRKGAGWGGGVGVLVGLFAPPMLASVAVGAAAGAVVGKFADHKLKSGLEDTLGAALAARSAAVIAVAAAVVAAGCGAGPAGCSGEVGGRDGRQQADRPEDLVG